MHLPTMATNLEYYFVRSLEMWDIAILICRDENDRS